MARDEVLYTGATSASYARTRREQENIAKLEQKANILPAAELIQAEIKKHREAISKELANVIHVEMSYEDIKSTVIGLRLADSRMQLLESKLLSIVNAKPIKRKREVSNEL